MVDPLMALEDDESIGNDLAWDDLGPKCLTAESTYPPEGVHVDAHCAGEMCEMSGTTEVKPLDDVSDPPLPLEAWHDAAASCEKFRIISQRDRGIARNPDRSAAFLSRASKQLDALEQTVQQRKKYELSLVRSTLERITSLQSAGGLMERGASAGAERRAALARCLPPTKARESSQAAIELDHSFKSALRRFRGRITEAVWFEIDMQHQASTSTTRGSQSVIRSSVQEIGFPQSPGPVQGLSTGGLVEIGGSDPAVPSVPTPPQPLGDCSNAYPRNSSATATATATTTATTTATAAPLAALAFQEDAGRQAEIRSGARRFLTQCQADMRQAIRDFLTQAARLVPPALPAS